MNTYTTQSPTELAAVPCSAFLPDDRRFYWWRCGPDGHWLIVMVRNGLCLMPGFSQAHKVADQKGEFWPVPIDPPSWPNAEEIIEGMKQPPIICPHCKSGLLWSEDRGPHCDGCDDFDPETDLPNVPALAQAAQDIAITNQ